VLVEYEPDARMTLLDMATQEIELSLMLCGKVDLRTAQDLSRYFRERVVNTAELLYERQ
jgi:predicted nucleotidyltransferase